MAVKRQLEVALAEIEHAGKRGFFEPARRFLQLVSRLSFFSRATDKLEHADLCGISRVCRPVWSNTSSVMSQVREQKVRDSEHVTLLGSQLLRQHRHRLREEECGSFGLPCCIPMLINLAIQITYELIFWAVCFDSASCLIIFLCFAVWLITEQVAVAAMDTKALQLAVELVGDIKRKFPSSQRAIRLTVRHRASC